MTSRSLRHDFFVDRTFSMFPPIPKNKNRRPFPVACVEDRVVNQFERSSGRSSTSSSICSQCQTQSTKSRQGEGRGFWDSSDRGRNPGRIKTESLCVDHKIKPVTSVQQKTTTSVNRSVKRLSNRCRSSQDAVNPIRSNTGEAGPVVSSVCHFDATA